MTQRLELVWPGKEKFLLVPRDESGKPVWVEPDHPAAREVRLTDFTAEHGTVDGDDPWKDNLLFTGDSLDVLRVLREVPEFARHYRGKVGLVIWIPGLRPEMTFLRSEPPFLGFVVMVLTISRAGRSADECVAAPGFRGVRRRGS